MYYLVEVRQPTHGRLPGEILAIKATDGQIGNVLWRKRILDEERYDVGALKVLDKTDEAPDGLVVIDENGAAIAPPAKPVQTFAPIKSDPPPPVQPAQPPFDASPLIARIEALEKRKQAPDLTDAVHKVLNDLLGVHDALDNHERRIVELEHAHPQQQSAPAMAGSWRDILSNAENDNGLADLVARVQQLEDKTAEPDPLPVPQQREAAKARIIGAVRGRLLDAVSGEIQHQLAMLSVNGNAKATLLLQKVRQDVSAYANEIIERREGNDTAAGSEWEAAVNLVIARDKWVKAVGDASDVTIDATLKNALAEIGGIGANGG